MTVGWAPRQRIGWVTLLILGAGIVVACSDDDDSVGTSNGNAGEAGARDTAGGSSSTSMSGKSNGGATTGGGGAALGGNGAAGDSPVSTGGAEGGTPGANGGEMNASGGDATSNAGSGGDGGANNLPAGPHIACPALGESFVLSPGAPYTDEELALSKAFGCDLDDITQRGLSVKRFELNTTQLEVLSSPYLMSGNYDWFAVRPDCGQNGYVEPLIVSPNPSSQATLYPLVFAQLLSPGVYTRVICGANVLEEQVPLPAAAPNVDCQHAVALKPGEANAYAETRIWNQPALFYEISLGDPQPDSSWEVELNTSTLETSAPTVVKLHGLTTAFEQEADEHVLGHLPAFEKVPPGNYCVELKTQNGVKYSIFYSAFGSQ